MSLTPATDGLMALVEWAFGSITGLSTVITFIIGARWLRRAAVIGDILNTLGWYAVGLALLMFAGVISFHPGALMDLLASGADLASSFL